MFVRQWSGLKAIPISALLLCIAGLPAPAQHSDGGEAQRLFANLCSACHGNTGKGGRGPDITTGQWKHGGSDDDLERTITKGVPNTEMPGFPLSPSDARLLVSFVRSLGATAQEEIAGDSERGRNAFFGAAQCSLCHMFGGSGGVIGPDLSNIAKRSNAAALRQSIQDPDAVVRTGFDTVEVKTRQGLAIRGVARHEDTFSIQIIDANAKLHLLLKKDLAGLKHTHKSMMPAAKISRAEVDDLVAFLIRYDPARIALPEWHPAADFNVSYSRLKNAAAEPWNWLTYWGDYAGKHASPLKSITPANVTGLRAQWSYQFGSGHVETSPIVVDGVMFITGPLNDADALDARTGSRIWHYSRPLPKVANHCTVMTNRGFAVLGDRLYLGTLDSHLVALDAKSGNTVWDVEVIDYKKGFSITHAPLAIDGKIIVGITAGECALTGFVDAYDAASGKRLWRTYSVAQPGDPNRESWGGTSADFGGSPTWMTGTYDPDSDTIFWPTGNPGPDYNGRSRAGDNLYSSAVLALAPETGKMKWWFQYTPHDVHDWDGTQTPVLIDGLVRGQKRKLLVTANRNAFYYVLDRLTGEFLTGQAFAKQTWAKGLDDKGRPIVLPNTDPTPEGNYVCPDAAGAANWGAPSYDAATGLLYVSVREACATYKSVEKEPQPGFGFTGGGAEVDPKVGEPGSVRALEATTGKRRWDYPIQIGSSSTGNLATAGGVVFASSADGNLIALDARTGKHLWHYQTGARIVSSPISYAVDGKQYIAIAGQSVLMTFALP
jgi:PQQ-dependent dehydrogenase (methanol/ethanol family)